MTAPNLAAVPTPDVDPDPFTPPEPVAAAPTAVELPSPPDPEPDPEPADTWAHEWLDFQGDRIAYRRPTAGALNAVALATGQYSTDQRRLKFTNMFLVNHLSDESYDQVITRAMNPDDADYTDDTLGELVGLIAESVTVKGK